MADGELQVDIVPDESAIEDIQDGQVEVSSDGEFGQQVEEQNDRLGGIGRSVFKIAKILTVVVALIAAVVPILRQIGEALDISFEDIRTAAVEAINSLKQSVSDALTLGEFRGTPNNAAEGFAAGAAPPGLGPLVVNALDNLRQNNQGTSESQQPNFNLFTSRDEMLGDSTMQEFRSNNVFLNNNGGGSGGNINP